MKYKLEAFVVAKGFDAQLGEYIKIHLYHRHDRQSPNSQQLELPGCTHRAHGYPTHQVQEGTGSNAEEGIKGFVK